MGRRAKSEDGPRKKRGYRVSDADHAVFLEASAAQGVSLNDWLHLAALRLSKMLEMRAYLGRDPR